MTREEAIKCLTIEIGLRSSGYCDHLAHGGKQDKGEEEFLDSLDMAIAALREQPRWISVEERLPAETGVYLVHDISMGIRVFYFGKGEVRSGWFGVTHWMPLPEPPTEEEV